MSIGSLDNSLKPTIGESMTALSVEVRRVKKHGLIPAGSSRWIPDVPDEVA